MTNQILPLPVFGKRSILFILFLFLSIINCIILLIPLTANGEDGKNDSIFFRINSDVIVEIDEVFKTIVSLNGPVDIRGRVDGSVISVGNPVYVHGVVENNVLVLGADIVLTEGSAIRNDAVTIGGEILQSYGSMVGGNIKELNHFFHWNFKDFPGRLLYFIQRPFSYFGAVPLKNFLTFRIIFMLLFTALVVVLLPKHITTVAESIQHQPWKHFFIGLLGVIFMMPLIAFLGIIITGMPLIITLFLLAGLIGGVAVKYIIGHRMLSVFNTENIAVIWCVFSGLLILEALRMIPLVAIIILPFLYLLGLGGVIYTRFGTKPDRFV